jgi:hypothetical protein
MLRLASIVVGFFLVSGFSHADSPPVAIECTWTKPAQLAPIPPDSGPLRLEGVYCVEPSLPRGLERPQLSPDGNWLLLFDDRPRMWLSNIHDATKIHSFGVFPNPLSKAGARWYVWADDSRSVLAATQDKQGNGFATGPMKPIMFSIDGSTQPLPELTHPAGPLDDLFWIGNTGLAIAAFGTQGYHYENPTIAIVDARKGQIIQAVALASLPDGPYKTFFVIHGRLNSQGQVHALIALPHGRWAEWHQGDAPRMVPFDETNALKHWFALPPDGKHVLMMQGLAASGIICEFWSKNCPLPASYPDPIAQLLEISTGRVVWSLDGTEKESRGHNGPAISPDGRYALISILAESGVKPVPTIALISMADGKILQKINHYSKVFAFSSDSKIAWIIDDTFVAQYLIRD